MYSIHVRISYSMHGRVWPDSPHVYTCTVAIDFALWEFVEHDMYFLSTCMYCTCMYIYAILKSIGGHFAGRKSFITVQ